MYNISQHSAALKQHVKIWGQTLVPHPVFSPPGNSIHANNIFVYDGQNNNNIIESFLGHC